MSSGVSSNNPIVVAAFHAALLRQGLVVLGILALLALCWNILRAVQFRRAFAAATAGGDAGAAEAGAPLRPLARTARGSGEPLARRFLRILFGCLWVIDGLLQLQSQMPAGLPGQVVAPTSGASPAWVQHVVNFGITIWTRHPIAAATASVWIQLGIGAMLLVAPRGRWSRAAAVMSVGWGVVVWVFGETFGGVFAGGTSFLFGTPGAVLFYCVAGVLIALPERLFETDQVGRMMLRLAGVFLIGMAILQAWPGRSFWQGQARPGAAAGALAAMAQQMSQTAQPGLLSSLVAHFGSFDGAHGWAVNLVLSIALGVLGSLLIVGRPHRLLKATVIAAVVFCMAVWVFVQDFGFFGGTGTDPNSMIPFAALVVTGYLAAVCARPAEADSAAAAPASTGRRIDLAAWRESMLSRPSYLFRTIATIGMAGVFLVGAAPMALASVSSSADPVIWQALNGPPQYSDSPATPFTLVDQHGRTVSLSSLRGRVVALTFLDPVCTNDCPLIAQEFRQADQLLGSLSTKVEMVAVVANPLYRSTAVTSAFDRTEDLDGLSNWLFLTGSVAQLSSVWAHYGIEVHVEPGGAMVGHNDVAYVIDAAGHIRVELGTDPGPGTAASKASFAGVLASQIHRLIGSA